MEHKIAFHCLSVMILVLSNDFARRPMEPRSPITNALTVLLGNCNADLQQALHTSAAFPSLSPQGENHSSKPFLGAE